MKAVQDAFAKLEAEKALIVHRNAASQVTISASFSFSSKWLIPRLHKLEAEQADLDLRVDRRVLIPRPDTEHLVDWILEDLPPPPAPPDGSPRARLTTKLRSCQSCDLSFPDSSAPRPSASPPAKSESRRRASCRPISRSSRRRTARRSARSCSERA